MSVNKELFNYNSQSALESELPALAFLVPHPSESSYQRLYEKTNIYGVTRERWCLPFMTSPGLDHMELGHEFSLEHPFAST